MELELEPRARPLAYKVKAMSRETATQKTTNLLESDLRTHWSTGTNNKEWILLELDVPCLLSHLRIYNKSVLEWEFAVGLRYKPETFVKVRPRCEAPRREMIYPMNYTPCRYVRISCLRGNPIAIFFIQLIGISMAGLEPEFQPVVNYLLPEIISHKQDRHDIHLQLLQDVTNRLHEFLPQLETDLINFPESAESNIHFLAMLIGPFYPILLIVKEWKTEKGSLSCSDSDVSKNKLTSNLSVSSNFEAAPRRSSPSSLFKPSSCSIAFRLENVFMLLRKAHRDSSLGTVCRIASRALQKLVGPITSAEDSIPAGDSVADINDDGAKTDSLQDFNLTDYSSLFGEEFKMPDDCWDASFVNLVDIASIEEAILHVLYACASQPCLCDKLADNISGFWSVLPLIQALLPALRPIHGYLDQVDDSFSQWDNPFSHRALSQITSSLSSSALHSVLCASAGYLSSFLPSHAKAACVLMDLCSGPLAPWIPTVLVKVDLAIELLEDLLPTIQCASQCIGHAGAALKYIILALSGHMDGILPKFKEVKHKILFLVEMLNPFLNPAVTATRNTLAFGDVSAMFMEEEERNCSIALNIIRSAVQRPGVLTSLESEWRRGSVAPSVLLSVLGPHLPLPPEIDLCKFSVSKATEQDISPALSDFSVIDHMPPSKSSFVEGFDGKCDSTGAVLKTDENEDANMLFAPPELKNMMLISSKIKSTSLDKDISGSNYSPKEKLHNQNVSVDEIQNCLTLKTGISIEYYNMQADYLQLVNLEDCKSWASEFQHLAFDLHSLDNITQESHEAAIDALLLAAECYINPFFLLSFRSSPKHFVQTNTHGTIYKIYQKNKIIELGKDFKKNTKDLGTVPHLERKRDKVVLEILLQAAEFDRRYQGNATKEFPCVIESTGDSESSEIDMQAADAITLVRKNQALLCHFLIQRLLNEHQTLHEVLLQSLLFYLCSATALYCPPENIIDVIIQSAENLNAMLTYSYHQLKESNGKMDHEMLHGIQRHWMLLQRLVMASSGNDSGTQSKNMVYGFQYGSLIPISAWIFRISKICVSSSPLARFVGWMALSQYAKQYLKRRLFISFDLSQLTSILSIFKDELSIVDNIANFDEGTSQYDHPNCKDSFGVEHPDLQKFIPDMKLQFGTFGEIILEAVGLQLKSLPSIAVSEALCWFSEFCMSPFSEYENENVSFASSTNHLRGYTRKNAKAIVLYLLEAITYEHMEAMIPEMPRVAQILVSLCKSSYCDVAFLDSVLHVLKPLISYALRKVSMGENLVIDDSLHDYEALCFGTLFSYINCKNGSNDISIKNVCQGPLIIFTLGALLPDLSLPRKQEILKSLSLWSDFTSEPTSSFFNYLSAFQSIIDGFLQQLIHFLRVFGIEIPQFEPQDNAKTMFILEGNLRASTDKLNNPHRNSFLSTVEMPEGTFDGSSFSFEKTSHLSPKDIENISQSFSDLFSQLYPSIEFCWELHFQLALKLALTSAKCCLLLRCLMSISHQDIDVIDEERDASGDVAVDSDNGSTHWKVGLQELTATIIGIQQNHCWQVASAMLDYLLGLPEVFSLDHVGTNICVALKNFCCHAPRISWRLQTDKWLSTLSSRSFIQFIGNCSSLGDLLCVMLGHSEPEQRCIALHHLGKLVGLDVDDSITKRSYMLHKDSILAENVLSASQATLSSLVSVTWDKVVALALSDPLFLIRANSMVLLSGYVPFADRHQLQSFLVTTHSTFPGIGTRVCPLQDPLVHHSLGLLAFACLYSPSEDISLIPESVWRNLDNMRTSKSVLDDLEKKICQALFELRAEAENGKEILKATLSSSSAVKETDPELRCIRESILQVLSSLTSAQSYFDFFSKKINQEDQELEEAEIELELLQKDKALVDSPGSQEEGAPPVSIVSYYSDGNNRLSKLKNEIRELERCKLREEIAARRQKKLLASRIRQKHLEEVALREMEILQELDRERSSEAEREIQRQRLLEAEQSKTRELRHNLDVEREKQTQRELQKELEQAESGAQTRREFSSNPSGRARERHRDRDNGRSSHEGSMRPSSRGREGGGTHPATSSSNMSATGAPTALLSGSRSFSSQPPTILQSRDRSDERVSGYEDSFVDGNRDPGDAGSVGEPETGSAYDSITGGYGSVPRQGSRGSRSRQQIIERREREGARGGKWERKHS